MKKFAHFSDIHLGYKQYGLEKRFQDFSDAWFSAIEMAIHEKVDFVVISGDLFQKRNTDPRAFEHAKEGLHMFANLGIPVVAIEGNHDRFIQQNEYSWMKVLAKEHLLILLDCTDENGNIVLQPYDTVRQTGSFVSLPCGVEIYGQRYRGERFKKDLQELKALFEAREKKHYTLFLAHSGVETEFHLADGDHVLLQDLQPFREKWDYVGLGHIHEKKIVDQWIFQPGSLETCSRSESKDGVQHGFFVVSFCEKSQQTLQVDLKIPKRRPYYSLDLFFSSPSHNDLQKEIERKLLQQMAEKSWDLGAIISLHLHFSYSLDEKKIDVEALIHLLELQCSPLLIRPIQIKTEETFLSTPKMEASSLLEIQRSCLEDFYRKENVPSHFIEDMTLLTLRVKQALEGDGSFEQIMEWMDEMIEKEKSSLQLDSQETKEQAA